MDDPPEKSIIIHGLSNKIIPHINGSKQESHGCWISNENIIRRIIDELPSGTKVWKIPPCLFHRKLTVFDWAIFNSHVWYNQMVYSLTLSLNMGHGGCSMDYWWILLDIPQKMIMDIPLLMDYWWIIHPFNDGFSITNPNKMDTQHPSRIYNIHQHPIHDGPMIIPHFLSFDVPIFGGLVEPALERVTIPEPMGTTMYPMGRNQDVHSPKECRNMILWDM